MDVTMNTGILIRYLLTTVGVFGLIFALAMLTPWMAKHVDKWIAAYREHHDPKKDETYGIRSIYELPPKEEESAEEETVDIGEEDDPEALAAAAVSAVIARNWDNSDEEDDEEDEYWDEEYGWDDEEWDDDQDDSWNR